MKRFVFIFLMLCPLWACSSCQDDEDKLPGTKPEMLIGKWEGLPQISLIDFRYYFKIYEFTKTGGTIQDMEYFPSKDRREERFAEYFTDWSYDGESTIYFLKKKGSQTSKWEKHIYELTPSYIKLGGIYEIYNKAN
jgi:hypothetical protein